ncbi:MAG: phosphoribosylformylglycinamidine synthase I [Candidatus Paceibacterota bacterium]
MKRPQVTIFSGYGLNCEEETKFAFEKAGADASIVHINDIIATPSLLVRSQIVAFPGGFSYGDDTGSGKAYANRVKEHLGDGLKKFLERDTLMIGICNGFQILTGTGILPGALIANDTPRFLCRWVDLKVEKGSSPWLRDIESLSLPIAHGEGKYFADASTLASLNSRNMVALRYAPGPLSEHFGLSANPNGALEDIAGVAAYEGRVLGLMPHPERAVRFTQLPHWTYLKEQYIREGVPLPADGPGIEVFRNAVRYFA